MKTSPVAAQAVPADAQSEPVDMASPPAEPVAPPVVEPEAAVQAAVEPRPTAVVQDMPVNEAIRNERPITPPPAGAMVFNIRNFHVYNADHRVVRQRAC